MFCRMSKWNSCLCLMSVLYNIKMLEYFQADHYTLSQSFFFFLNITKHVIMCVDIFVVQIKAYLVSIWDPLIYSLIGTHKLFKSFPKKSLNCPENRTRPAFELLLN